MNLNYQYDLRHDVTDNFASTLREDQQKQLNDLLTLLILLEGNISKLVEMCLLNTIDFSFIPDKTESSFGKLKRVSFCRLLFSDVFEFDTGVEKITPTLKW